MIDIVTGQGARIADMTPGGNIGSGGMDCWLTLEFKGPPEGTDARDVLVRFESVALKEPAKFEALYYERQEAPTMGVGPT